MNAYLKQHLSFLLIVLLVVLVACQQAPVEEPAAPVVDEGETPAEPAAGLANPAAVYCEGLGYRLESRETAAGTDAVCIFPDGNECGQWDFLAGRCGQEYSYCLNQGGIRLEEDGNIGICLFADGSTCREQLFSQGQCRPGDNPPAAEETDTEPAPAERPAEAPGVTVIGWMGYVLSTPEGAQFDDYVVVLPEGDVGEFGIEGASEDLQAQIVALRDREQPGKHAHFWGTLTCDVPDFGGCQLLVTRVQEDGSAEFLEVDPVDGWTGTITALSYDEPGAPQPDDAFTLSGPYPVQYGLDSAIAAASGERDLSEVIATLGDSGAEITIWGEMTCGVPDAGGCHIEVYRIETGGNLYEIAAE